MDGKRELLRHMLATIAYRGGKALRGAPAAFAAFRAGDDGRPAVEIVSHMGDLFDWSVAMAAGDGAWRTAAPQPWDAECARFFASLARLDDLLASDAALEAPLERLLQGPVGDALTHVGQLAMMRRMAGSPTVNENYFVADVRVGRVGAEQSRPVQTF